MIFRESDVFKRMQLDIRLSFLSDAVIPMLNYTWSFALHEILPDLIDYLCKCDYKTTFTCGEVARLLINSPSDIFQYVIRKAQLTRKQFENIINAWEKDDEDALIEILYELPCDTYNKECVILEVVEKLSTGISKFRINDSVDTNSPKILLNRIGSLFLEALAVVAGKEFNREDKEGRDKFGVIIDYINTYDYPDSDDEILCLAKIGLVIGNVIYYLFVKNYGETHPYSLMFNEIWTSRQAWEFRNSLTENEYAEMDADTESVVSEILGQLQYLADEQHQSPIESEVETTETHKAKVLKPNRMGSPDAIVFDSPKKEGFLNELFENIGSGFREMKLEWFTYCFGGNNGVRPNDYPDTFVWDNLQYKFVVFLRMLYTVGSARKANGFIFSKGGKEKKWSTVALKEKDHRQIVDKILEIIHRYDGRYVGDGIPWVKKELPKQK